VKVSTKLYIEQAKAKATQKGYLSKMEAHTTHARHSLSLDKMLGEKKVQLNGREWDLDLHEAALVEEHSQGLNPRDNCEELTKFIEFQRHLKEAKVECVTEAGWLAILVRDVCKVLVDLGMSPILGIPQDPCTTDDVLEVVGTILECLQKAYAFGHGP
jgi:hypothetical protein